MQILDQIRLVYNASIYGTFVQDSLGMVTFSSTGGKFFVDTNNILQLRYRAIFEEINTNPSASDLTSTTYNYPCDRVGLYMKNDKFIVAFQLESVVHFVYLPLDGSTTWIHTTTPP